MSIQKIFIICFTVSAVFLTFTSCKLECPDGYSGEDCELAESDQFIGVYEGLVNCGFVDQYTTVEIEKRIGPFDIMLFMTDPSEFVLNAHIDQDTIFIEEQSVAIPVIEDTLYYNLLPSRGLISNDTLEFHVKILTDSEPNPSAITCAFRLVK
jgi:hypothetical protein